MAREPGDLEIPAIDVGSARSQPRRVTVSEPKVVVTDPDSGPPQLLLEVEAQPGNVVVGTEVVYIARLLYSLHLTGGRFSEPVTSDPNAQVQPLGPAQYYDAERQGTRYRVTERRFSIFPQTEGELTIEPLVFDAQVMPSPTTGMGGFPSPFSMPTQRPEMRRVRSEALTIPVRPIPKGFDTRNWLPARKVQIQESWSQQARPFQVGVPVTRTLTLVAEGLPSARLPALDQDLPSDFKQYAERPVLRDERGVDGITGTRTEHLTLVATEPGSFELPVVEVPWWNVARQRAEIARLPARSVEVSEAPVARGKAYRDAVGARPPGEPALSPEGAIITSVSVPTHGVSLQNPWIWISAALAVVWAATVFLWLRSRKTRTATTRTVGPQQPVPATSHPPPPEPFAANEVSAPLVRPSVTEAEAPAGEPVRVRKPPSPRPPEARKKTPRSKPSMPAPSLTEQQNLRDEIKRAYRHKDRWAAKAAILAWANANWPGDPPRTLGDLAARSGPAIAEAVRKLDAAIYANQPTNWYDIPLWEELKRPKFGAKEPF
jgi:hypothetical protein